MIERVLISLYESLHHLMKGINEMHTNVNDIIDFIETSVQRTPVLFTTDRIDKSTLPKGFYHYEASYTDEGIIDYDTLAKQIKENFAGTVLSLKPLQFGENELYKLSTTKDLMMNSTKNFSSIEGFIKKHM